MSLPTWTRDAGTMKRDIDEHGYCLVEDALTPAQLAEARERLSEQAEAERKGGVVLFGDGRIGPEHGPGNNQNVSFLANKGRIFREIASRPDILDIVRHVLGEEIRIHNLLGLIVRIGGLEHGAAHGSMVRCHRPAAMTSRRFRSGSITRANPGQPDTPGPTLMPCIVMQRLLDAGRLH